MLTRPNSWPRSVDLLIWQSKAHVMLVFCFSDRSSWIFRLLWNFAVCRISQIYPQCTSLVSVHTTHFILFLFACWNRKTLSSEFNFTGCTRKEWASLNLFWVWSFSLLGCDCCGLSAVGRLQLSNVGQTTIVAEQCFSEPSKTGYANPVFLHHCVQKACFWHGLLNWKGGVCHWIACP